MYKLLCILLPLVLECIVYLYMDISMIDLATYFRDYLHQYVLFNHAVRYVNIYIH